MPYEVIVNGHTFQTGFKPLTDPDASTETEERTKEVKRRKALEDQGKLVTDKQNSDEFVHQHPESLVLIGKSRAYIPYESNSNCDAVSFVGKYSCVVLIDGTGHDNGANAYKHQQNSDKISQIVNDLLSSCSTITTSSTPSLPPRESSPALKSGKGPPVSPQSSLDTLSISLPASLPTKLNDMNVFDLGKLLTFEILKLNQLSDKRIHHLNCTLSLALKVKEMKNLYVISVHYGDSIVVKFSPKHPESLSIIARPRDSDFAMGRDCSGSGESAIETLITPIEEDEWILGLTDGIGEILCPLSEDHSLLPVALQNSQTWIPNLTRFSTKSSRPSSSPRGRSKKSNHNPPTTIITEPHKSHSSKTSSNPSSPRKELLSHDQHRNHHKTHRRSKTPESINHEHHSKNKEHPSNRKNSRRRGNSDGEIKQKETEGGLYLFEYCRELLRPLVREKVLLEHQLDDLAFFLIPPSSPPFTLTPSSPYCPPSSESVSVPLPSILQPLPQTQTQTQQGKLISSSSLKITRESCLVQ